MVEVSRAEPFMDHHRLSCFEIEAARRQALELPLAMEQVAISQKHWNCAQ